jgi:hypothetical protein
MSPDGPVAEDNTQISRRIDRSCARVLMFVFISVLFVINVPPHCGKITEKKYQCVPEKLLENG